MSLIRMSSSKPMAQTPHGFHAVGLAAERDMEWTEAGVEGASRFLKRIYRLLPIRRCPRQKHSFRTAALAVILPRRASCD